MVLADFLKTESGAVLLMNIVEEKGRLADNLKDALMDIVSYLAGKTGITEMEFTFSSKPAACCEKRVCYFVGNRTGREGGKVFCGTGERDGKDFVRVRFSA